MGRESGIGIVCGGPFLSARSSAKHNPHWMPVPEVTTFPRDNIRGEIHDRRCSGSVHDSIAAGRNQILLI